MNVGDVGRKYPECFGRWLRRVDLELANRNKKCWTQAGVCFVTYKSFGILEPWSRWLASWTRGLVTEVMEKVLPFVFLSGHAGSPDLHCSEGVPAPGEDRTHCPHCHHLERRPDVVRPSIQGPSTHLTGEHGQKQRIRLGFLGLDFFTSHLINSQL